ncbi:MAG: ABC transporter permease subunit [Lachnospiraceae bacterium]|nr:ABC transporter permease subunit [Lachnospiraceae bacterium]
MYGIQIAFRDFTFQGGITGSEWVGMKWFNYFFGSPLFGTLLKNTLILSIYSIAATFPAPIILALMIHNVPGNAFKRVIQTVTYLPNFISTVVLVGMIQCFFSLNSGFINTLIESLGGVAQNFIGMPQYFRHLYVWTGVWQGMGWNSIVFMAALSGVDPELHEAAKIDGAGKLQRIWHIDLPGILPTIQILFILRVGSVMSVGFEKVFLMQNSLNNTVSEIISTYVYKQGMLSMKYSYSAAIGLFNNIVNFIILVLANYISKRLDGDSLW